MLSEQAVKMLKEGQGTFVSPSLRRASQGGIVQLVPIRSRRSGKVVRINVYYRSASGKG
jgi:hypothetical protein